MGAKGKVVGAAAMVFERRLEGPIMRVWEHLTDPALLSGWLAEASFEARLGGAVRFKSGEKSERGIITRWEPPRALAYTWNEGGKTSHVTFELEANGDWVLLRLTHERLPPGELGDFGAGWRAHLDALAALIAAGTRQSRSQHLGAYAALRPQYVSSNWSD